MIAARVLLMLMIIIGRASGIGEGAFNADSLTNILDGLGRMFETIEAEDIETSRMMGRWFQMYKAAINFDVFRTQMFCPVSYFDLNPVMGDGGFTIQEAFRVISKTGPIEVYKRDVTEVKNGSYMVYTEEYFYPSQFVIIGAGPRFTDEVAKVAVDTSELEDDAIDSNETTTTTVQTTTTVEDATPYEYLIATDPNRLRLEIYARDPIAFMQKYNNEVLTFIKTKGFGGGAFWNEPQPIYQGPDCEYPTEKEVFARRVLRNQQQAQQRAAQANNGQIDQGSLTGTLFGGLNPQGVVNTFQGLFGSSGQQQSVQPAFPTQQFRPPVQPQRLNFNGQQQQQSLFINAK